MKTGVQNVSIKLIDPEITESLSMAIGNPEVFYGTDVQGPGEIEVSEKKYEIMEHEGTGEIGPGTRIILSIDASETPIDMLIALDTSYSMISEYEDTTRFDLAVDGILELIGQKSKKLVTGIMAYGVDWEMSVDLANASSFTKKKLTDLKKELSQIKHKGKAAAGTALNGSSEVFSIKGSSSLKVVVLLTDGADEIGPNPLKEADKLASRGIYIYPFYFGEETDQKSLTIFDRIAAKGHTTLFSLHNAAEEEKRRLIRASLKSAQLDEGDEGFGSEAAAVDDGDAEMDEDIPSATPVPEEGEPDDMPEDMPQDNPEDIPEDISGDNLGDRSGNMSEDIPEDASVDEPGETSEGELVLGPDDQPEKEGAEPTDNGSTDLSRDGSEDLVIPSGSELLIRELQKLGNGLTFLIQEGGGEFSADEDSDGLVIKAGVPVDDTETTESSNEPTFNRTPKIIDAIKHFIEWVKGLIW